MKESDKYAAKAPEDFRRVWDEIRVCATLIQHGHARIVRVTHKDGSVCRYTKTNR